MATGTLSIDYALRHFHSLSRTTSPRAARPTPEIPGALGNRNPGDSVDYSGRSPGPAAPRVPAVSSAAFGCWRTLEGAGEFGGERVGRALCSCPCPPGRIPVLRAPKGTLPGKLHTHDRQQVDY